MATNPSDLSPNSKDETALNDSLQKDPSREVENAISSLQYTESSAEQMPALEDKHEILDKAIPNEKSGFNTTINNNGPHKRSRLVLISTNVESVHLRSFLEELKNRKEEYLYLYQFASLEDQVSLLHLTSLNFHTLNILIEYNQNFVPHTQLLTNFISQNSVYIKSFKEITYHIQFSGQRKWSEYSENEKAQYYSFLSTLGAVAGSQVMHCSIINKYSPDTMFLTEKDELIKLGKEINEDIQLWPNLKILDYSGNYIRLLPGVRLPDTLEVLNIGGGFSLETLTSFKMPKNLKTLIAYNGSITSVDNISFPFTLKSLSLKNNKLYFINAIEYPIGLEQLDVSNNRVESLRGVTFPPNLKKLLLSDNPIDCIKGVKFPDTIEYMDVSYIPNESMFGVKFPDMLQYLNLQKSMTNPRGLKLPMALKELNLADNNVNSINPLKLPNSIEILNLASNSVKTLNKVQFPLALRELYLGNNLITTLKNVSFPLGLEVLDVGMQANFEDNDKRITTLKDVIFPPSLKVLRLSYHAIKSLESIDFPSSLTELTLSYNELKLIRNVHFGNNLRVLDLSGNQELFNIDRLFVPDSVKDLRIPSQLIPNLPPYIIKRTNNKDIIITKSLPY